MTEVSNKHLSGQNETGSVCSFDTTALLQGAKTADKLEITHALQLL